MELDICVNAFSHFLVYTLKHVQRHSKSTYSSKGKTQQSTQGDLEYKATHSGNLNELKITRQLNGFR